MKLVIGISGASGVIYGIRLLELVSSMDAVETHLVVTRSARLTIATESDRTLGELERLADVHYSLTDIGAPISSGSFRADAMVVAPCSMKTLSAIVHSLSDNLLTRAADVMLKERRPLVLMPRESPLHAGHCKLLYDAALLGAIIAPPAPAFYNRPQTIEDLVDHSVGRALAVIGLDVGVARRWAGTGPSSSHGAAVTRYDDNRRP